MHHYTPSWSRTQRDLFLKCPTAWVRAYASASKGRRATSAGRVKPWNLLLRSLKATVIEQLEALRNGTEWTQEVAQRSLRLRFMDSLRVTSNRMPHPQFEAMLIVANHRMKLLWRTDVLVQLQRGIHPQWSVLDRLDSEHIDGIDLFASPDLAIRVQAKWHLIRFDMQSSGTNASEQLEALAMVLWATKRTGLPNMPAMYAVRTIGWRGGAWVHTIVEVSTKEVEMAKRMIGHDVAEMKACVDASRYNLQTVPLAKDGSECSSCRFKPVCLGNDTLETMRRKRILRLASSGV